MIKRDCFGCVPGQKDCQVMTENICEKRKCSFYKTREDYKRGLVGLPPKKIEEDNNRVPAKRPKGKTLRGKEEGQCSDGNLAEKQEDRSGICSRRGRKGKPVRCVDTGEIFASATMAAYELGFTATKISRCCRGELRQLKGYRFEYVETEA